MTKTSYYPTFVQSGSGLPAFRGGSMQRGYGIGGMFKGLLRAAAPKLKSFGKQIGKTALKTGLQTFGDVISGESLKTAVKRRAKENFKQLVTPPAKRINAGTVEKGITRQSNTKGARTKQKSGRSKKNTTAKTSFGIF